jgi:hypothetical protein
MRLNGNSRRFMASGLVLFRTFGGAQLSPRLGDADLAVVSSVATKEATHDNVQSSDTSSVHQR